jgi:WD40 repeat protein
MVSQVETERGALPLLAFAMARLWELRDRERRMLTREAYGSIGGVAGALAQHAEATIEAIGFQRLPVVREIFRNLVTSQGTRAVREVDELLSIFDEPARQEARSVLDALIDARLLTSFEDHPVDADAASRNRRVEIVHESLLRAWPRLVRWQTQDADAAQLRDQLRQAAKLWSDRGRPDDLLWSGASLREFLVWRDRYVGGLSASEEAFADAMVRQAERRRRRRRLVSVGVTLVALVVAAVTTSLWRRSEEHARRLEARRFAETARQLLRRSPPEAFVNARRSLEFIDTPEGRWLVTQALWRSPMPLAVDTRDSVKFPVSASFSPDKPWLAVGNTAGELWLLPRDGGEQRRWQAHASPVALMFTPEPSVIVSHAMGDPASVFWSVPEGTRLGEEFAVGERPPTDISPVDAYGVFRAVRFAPDPEAPGGWSIDPRALRLREKLQLGHRPRSALAPDGRALFLAQGPELMVADVEAPDIPPKMVGRCGSDVRQIVFAPDGRVFATADASGGVDVWRFADNTATRIRSWQGLVGDDIHHLGFDGTGRLLVASYDMGGVQIFGLNDPPGADPLRIRPGGSRVIQSEFDPTNRWLVTAAMGRLAVWPLDRSRYPFVFRGHSGSVDKLEFGPDGDFLVSAATDGTVRYWPLDAAAGDAPLVLHDWKTSIEALVAWVDVSEDGRVVVATGSQNHVRVIPLDGRPAFDLTEADQRITRAAVSADGRLVAVVGRFDERYQIRIYDIENRAERNIDLPQDLGWPPSGVPVVFTGDGRLLGSVLGRIHEWDLETADARVVLEDVGTMGFDGSGRTLIGRREGDGSGELVATVYSLDDGSSTRLSSHGSRANALALDSTGAIAVTGDLLGGIRVGPVTGETPHLLSTEDVSVGAVAVSSDGRWIASGHDDGSIRVWPMPDLEKPPINELPYDELMAKLDSLTNLKLVDDPLKPGELMVRTGPFPGWETVPEW